MWKESIRSKENHPGGPPFIHRPSVTYLNLQFLIDFSFSLLRLSCLHLSLSSTHTYVLPSSCSLSSPLRLLALVIHIYFVLSCPRSLNIFGFFFCSLGTTNLIQQNIFDFQCQTQKNVHFSHFPPPSVAVLGSQKASVHQSIGFIHRSVSCHYIHPDSDLFDCSNSVHRL